MHAEPAEDAGRTLPSQWKSLPPVSQLPSPTPPPAREPPSAAYPSPVDDEPDLPSPQQIAASSARRVDASTYSRGGTPPEPRRTSSLGWPQRSAGQPRSYGAQASSWPQAPSRATTPPPSTSRATDDRAHGGQDTGAEPSGSSSSETTDRGGGSGGGGLFDVDEPFEAAKAKALRMLGYSPLSSWEVCLPPSPSPTPLHASSAGAAAGRVSSHQSLPPVAASHAGSSLLSCQLNVDAGAGASLSLGSSAALTLPLCSSVISPSIRAGVCVPPRPLSGQWLQDPHFVTSPPLVLSWVQLKERLQERHFVTAVLAERVTAWLSRTVRGEWFFCCCWEAKGREEDLGGAAFCAAKSAMLET